MDKMKRQTGILPGRALLVLDGRLIAIAAVVCLLAFAAQRARAQAPQQPTQIEVGAPAQADLGKLMTAQAVLADSQGHPISGAQIYFTTEATFLGVTKDVVMAQGLTNENGQAVAHFPIDSTGTFNLRAEFRGDEQYAPSTATTQVQIIGDGQVYSDHFGAQPSGITATQAGASAAAFQSLSPWNRALRSALSGWPVGIALLLVWSMYLVAMGYVFHIAFLAKEPQPTPTLGTPDSRRSP
jgi:hypothetical protein